jgi:hypothetical protein
LYRYVLDDNLKPLLIEVNASPALSSDTDAVGRCALTPPDP